MRLLPKIVRFGGLSLSGDAVRIKDVGPAPPADAGAGVSGGEEFEAAEIQADEFSDGQDAPPAAEGAQGAAPRRQGDAAVRGEIIQGAMAEAGRIMAEAAKGAELEHAQLLEDARQQAQRLHSSAAEQGHREGFAAVVGEVRELAEGIEAAIAAFEGGRAAFEAEYEEQLRWLAIEIASKVLAKKISEDDSEMTEMVHKAVQSIKGEAWIRVEVSQEMVRLIDRLESLYAGHDGIEVNAAPLPAGTVHIESPGGVVDASLRTQLENLRDYFAKPG